MSLQRGPFGPCLLLSAVDPAVETEVFIETNSITTMPAPIAVSSLN
jgi:hypothetical protein